MVNVGCFRLFSGCLPPHWSSPAATCDIPHMTFIQGRALTDDSKQLCTTAKKSPQSHLMRLGTIALPWRGIPMFKTPPLGFCNNGLCKEKIENKRTRCLTYTYISPAFLLLFSFSQQNSAHRCLQSLVKKICFFSFSPGFPEIKDHIFSLYI